MDEGEKDTKLQLEPVLLLPTYTCQEQQCFADATHCQLVSHFADKIQS